MIRRGIEEGRRTFANTLKYVLITMSANLGNMVSMAVASLLLPFLPLWPARFCSTTSSRTFPPSALRTMRSIGDGRAARRWNMSFIGRFMIAFGSSARCSTS